MRDTKLKYFLIAVTMMFIAFSSTDTLSHLFFLSLFFSTLDCFDRVIFSRIFDNLLSHGYSLYCLYSEISLPISGLLVLQSTLATAVSNLIMINFIFLHSLL